MDSSSGLCSGSGFGALAGCIAGAGWPVCWVEFPSLLAGPALGPTKVWNASSDLSRCLWPTTKPVAVSLPRPVTGAFLPLPDITGEVAALQCDLY